MTDLGPRVLIVEDEAPLHKFIRVSLSSHRYRIIEAERAGQVTTPRLHCLLPTEPVHMCAPLKR